MENSETYKAKVYCKNCDLNKEIDIQKGVKIDETACPTCGTIFKKLPQLIEQKRMSGQ
jgi:Zn finger protein HypA/HybF involved in hydrogenase expression